MESKGCLAAQRVKQSAVHAGALKLLHEEEEESFFGVHRSSSGVVGL